MYPTQLQPHRAGYHARMNGMGGRSRGLGDWPTAPTSIPTQAGDGSGWIAVVVTGPPGSKLNWQQVSGSNPNMMLVWKGSVGALQEIGYGSGDSNRDWPYITPNQTFTFYLLPTDANGKAYAPVETLTVQSAPGIYASVHTPSATLAALQAANPGLQTYAPSHDTAPPPAAPWYEAAGDVNAFGMNIPVLGIAIVAGAAIFGPRILGGR